jgi:hypothetical protein
MKSLDYVRINRNMPWITRGMKVVVNGRKGHVAGGHRGGNIAVKFPDQSWTSHCHPKWETVYYDKDGNVIADYREKKEQQA